MIQFMPEMTQAERRAVLEQNADKVEQTTYMKPLTEHDVAARMEKLSVNSIRLADLDAEKKAAMDIFKGKINPLKNENSELITEIRSRQTKVEGMIYHMANHDNDMMETYDEEGFLLATRRLRPDEKQARMFKAIAM